MSSIAEAIKEIKDVTNRQAELIDKMVLFIADQDGIIERQSTLINNLEEEALNNGTEVVRLKDKVLELVNEIATLNHERK